MQSLTSWNRLVNDHTLNRILQAPSGFLKSFQDGDMYEECTKGIVLVHIDSVSLRVGGYRIVFGCGLVFQGVFLALHLFGFSELCIARFLKRR